MKAKLAARNLKHARGWRLIGITNAGVYRTRLIMTKVEAMQGYSIWAGGNRINHGE